MTTTANHRTADYPVDAQFLDRWSPRSLTGEPIPEAVLMTCFEAARWAPSSYNSQPWRFLYSVPGAADWGKFLGLLAERNQMWAKNASALIVLVSKTTMLTPAKPDPVPSHSHSLDTGAAWGNFALQASLLGWVAHGMVGFDMERARAELNVPADCRVEAALAIGKLGDKSALPEMFQAGETPNGRKPLAETVFKGGFPAV